jgi:hypothetical protein
MDDPPGEELGGKVKSSGMKTMNSKNHCRLALALGLLLLAFLPCANAADAPSAPAILIYNTPGYPRPGATNLSPRLVAALWSDGKIIWSKDFVAGGPPYFQGRFTPDKLGSLVRSLEADGAFTNASLQRPWFGPDAQTTRIVVSNGTHRLIMESWHELYERKTNVIATAQGLVPLNGRDRAAVQQEQPQDYRLFRKTWSEIRATVTSLVPEKGEPFGGELPVMKR